MSGNHYYAFTPHQCNTINLLNYLRSKDENMAWRLSNWQSCWSKQLIYCEFNFWSQRSPLVWSYVYEFVGCFIFGRALPPWKQLNIGSCSWVTVNLFMYKLFQLLVVENDCWRTAWPAESKGESLHSSKRFAWLVDFFLWLNFQFSFSSFRISTVWQADELSRW